MTLKEYLRNANPRLDKLADEAEAQRTADEEFAYENKAKQNNEKLIGGNIYDKI